MSLPFTYGRQTESPDFANRHKEIEHLSTNFLNNVNTMLVAPRRWGKSSLVRHVATHLQKKNKSIRFCFIDLFNTRSEKEFYELYTRELLLASSNKWEEIVAQKNIVLLIWK
jgi:predicted AAA+ superfamily ATPase